MTLDQTPLPVVAAVSRIVTRVVDRVVGDRVDYPLLVCMATVEALKCFGIESRIMYGEAGWIEILEDQAPVWAGCWGENYHFWVATQFGEVVDLNTSVAWQKRSHTSPMLKALYSAPMLWSREVPSFYHYVPEGVAEVDLTDQRDQRHHRLVIAEVQEKCQLIASNISNSENGDQNQNQSDLEFPNEPILCPGRRVLDDSKGTFRYFERALAVAGVPQYPVN